MGLRRCSRGGGLKQPNPFGLHDMHGKVWAWCEDDFDSGFYSKPEAKGPDPVSTSGSGSPGAAAGPAPPAAAGPPSARDDLDFPRTMPLP